MTKINTKGFTIVTICRDYVDGKIIGPYVDGGVLPFFSSREEAFAAAERAAREEAEELNDGADEGVSFGIPEDQGYESASEVKVEYYYNDNTELVTKREIRELV